MRIIWWRARKKACQTQFLSVKKHRQRKNKERQTINTFYTKKSIDGATRGKVEHRTKSWDQKFLVRSARKRLNRWTKTSVRFDARVNTKLSTRWTCKKRDTVRLIKKVIHHGRIKRNSTKGEASHSTPWIYNRRTNY